MTETAIICTIFGVFILVSYTLGLYNGQKLANKEKVSIPVVNPVKAVQEYQEDKREKKELEEFNTMLSNIENYDGTGLGQQEI